MKKYLTKEYIKRTLLMLLSVIMMGVCVQILERTNLGPDPCSALNFGLSRLLHISFGTWQMLLNVVLFLLIFWQNKKLFGLGSIGNMVVVGYAADFTGWVLERLGVMPASVQMPLGQSVAIMLPTLVLFSFVAAIYMNCGLGTSPYDALPYLLHQKIEKATKKTIPFKVIRMSYDGLVTLVAWLVGGSVGIVTIFMIFLLGPFIDMVSRLIEKSGIFKKE